VSAQQGAWRWHRWLGWAIGLQVLVWTSSGLLFAWLPFEPWVKAGDQFQRPVLELSALPPALAALDAPRVTSLAIVATPQGAAWRVGLRGEPRPRYLPLDGGTWTPPDAAAVQRFAATLLREPLPVLAVERLASVPRRLGLVEETGGRGDVWRVRFDDTLGTRIYLDGQGGDFVAIRNEAWVWYDFFWRLHIMDYTGGEDFNNILLRVAALLAWGLTGLGVLLALLALRRAVRRRIQA
jgi:PepSY-associated TM region